MLCSAVKGKRLLGAALVAASLVIALLPASAAAQEGATGTVALLDDRGLLDRVELHVSGLPQPPAGSAYRAWLRSDDQTLVEFLGDVGFTGPTEGVLAWSQPAGEPLFIQFSEVLVTLEDGAFATQPGPVALRARVDAGALTHFRRLLVRWPDSRYGTASIQGLRQLSAAARGHAAVLREAAAGGDLPAIRRKAEHLINLIEGSRGASFGDYDRDGRAEDPGDGVGLLPYAWGALTQSQFAWATAIDERVAESSLAIQPPVRFGLDWAGFVRDIGIELAGTQDLTRARELTGHLSIAVDRIAAAIDPQSDASLRGIVEARELTPAYESALALLQLPLLSTNATTATATAGHDGS